jgi:hypothetical protein
MSSRNTAAAEDYEPDANPLQPAIQVLERRLADTLDLAACIDRLRTDSSGDACEKLRSLLEGLLQELDACCSLFRHRIGSFALRLQHTPGIEASGHSDSRLFADGSDCREWLESLLNRYSYFVRLSTVSIARLELVGDFESARIVGRAVEAAEKASGSSKRTWKVSRYGWTKGVCRTGLGVDPQA